MAEPIKDLWDAAGCAETLGVHIDRIQSGLALWADRVENEVPPGKASDTDAWAYHANFIARFSEYLCLLCSIQVDLAQFVAGFNEFIDTLYTVAREERKKKEIGDAEG